MLDDGMRFFEDHGALVGLENQQRYVTDWAGPEARIKSIALKLGAPNFAGDVMTLSGAVVGKSEADGEGLVDVRVSGANSLGEHVGATVRFSLPTGGQA